MQPTLPSRKCQRTVKPLVQADHFQVRADFSHQATKAEAIAIDAQVRQQKRKVIARNRAIALAQIAAAAAVKETK